MFDKKNNYGCLEEKRRQFKDLIGKSVAVHTLIKINKTWGPSRPAIPIIKPNYLLGDFSIMEPPKKIVKLNDTSLQTPLFQIPFIAFNTVSGISKQVYIIYSMHSQFPV